MFLSTLQVKSGGALHFNLLFIANYGKVLHMYVGYFYFFLAVPANLPILHVLTSRAVAPLLSKL